MRRAVLALLLAAAAAGAWAVTLADGDRQRAQKRAQGDLRGLFVGKAVARAALAQLGQPYRWGGDAPGGFDCSGLTCWAYRQAGVAIPKRAYDQFMGGQEIPDSCLQPGDLLFFMPSDVMASMHVGVYVGEGLMVHAPGTGKPVVRARFDSRFFKNRYAGARRWRPPSTPTPAP